MLRHADSDPQGDLDETLYLGIETKFPVRMPISFGAVEYLGTMRSMQLYAGSNLLFSSGVNYPSGENLADVTIPIGTSTLRLVVDGHPADNSPSSYGYYFDFQP